MSVSIPENDDCIVRCPCLIWNGHARKHWDGTAELMAYLCETCDQVHLSIASPELGGGLVQVNAMLPQEDADKLAHLLLAPRVAKWETKQ